MPHRTRHVQQDTLAQQLARVEADIPATLSAAKAARPANQSAPHLPRRYTQRLNTLRAERTRILATTAQPCQP